MKAPSSGLHGPAHRPASRLCPQEEHRLEREEGEEIRPSGDLVDSEHGLPLVEKIDLLGGEGVEEDGVRHESHHVELATLCAAV